MSKKMSRNRKIFISANCENKICLQGEVSIGEYNLLIINITLNEAGTYKCIGDVNGTIVSAEAYVTVTGMHITFVLTPKLRK